MKSWLKLPDGAKVSTEGGHICQKDRLQHTLHPNYLDLRWATDPRYVLQARRKVLHKLITPQFLGGVISYGQCFSTELVWHRSSNFFEYGLPDYGRFTHAKLLYTLEMKLYHYS